MSSTMTAAATEPKMPAELRPRSALSLRTSTSARKPPTNEPTMPGTMVAPDAHGVAPRHDEAGEGAGDEANHDDAEDEADQEVSEKHGRAAWFPSTGACKRCGRCV
ncbi:MAG TPA: hypothetical protein VHT97_07570 [Acidimicrobiales bacterium]|jgi:hypothetical protein|nr:hypothetical protein [Acidimicrobiales bacterium]